jgi:hypothetical protein
MNLRNFFAELKRRNVVRVAALMRKIGLTAP